LDQQGLAPLPAASDLSTFTACRTENNQLEIWTTPAAAGFPRTTEFNLAFQAKHSDIRVRTLGMELKQLPEPN
jgi:hypothetical protein